MKAAVVEELGRPPTYREVDDPVATGELVVADVRAAAVKNIERMLVAGTHYGSEHLTLPGVIGLDAVVELPDGRRVYTGGAPPGGGMAERLLVHPGWVVEVPDGVDDVSAAALSNAAISAWFALEYAGKFEGGQSVLVLGATGVTGSLAVQLAKHKFGAGRVVAVGRDAERLARLITLGDDDTITLFGAESAGGGLTAAIERIHGERPIDLVLDYLWGEPARQTLRALAHDDLAAGFHRTRYVQIGEMAGPTIELPAAVLRSAGIELLGQGGGSVPQEAYGRVMTEILPALYAMLAAGTITVDTEVRPLSQVSEAWDALVPSGVRLVLTLDREAVSVAGR